MVAKAKPPKPAPKKRGRPSSFTVAIGNTICKRLANGESLRTICSDAKMPSDVTVRKWLSSPERSEFLSQYAHAREAQADFYAESIIEISDDGRNDTYVDDDGRVKVDQDVIARSRLRVDARKWYASKLAPKKYGDKITQEVSGPDGGPQQHEHRIDISAEESYRMMIEKK